MIELVVSALGIIGSLVAAIRWLMKVNFKQNKELLAAKKDLYQERFENLKAVTNELEISLKKTNLKLDEAMKESRAARAELIKAKEEIIRYVESSEKQLKFLREQVIKLGGETFMVTSQETKG